MIGDPDDIDDLALALTPSEAMRLTPRASVGAALACVPVETFPVREAVRAFGAALDEADEP